MQDNLEYDEKIKSELQEKLQLPNEVREKVQNAYEKLEENERSNKSMEKQGKFKLSKILAIAASLIIVVFLAGNGVAYAMGANNIYTWILQSIGIQQENYDEVKTEVNKTVENNGIRVTLLDCAYDADTFICAYKVEDLEGKIRNINKKYQESLEPDVVSNIYDQMYFEGNYKYYIDVNQDKAYTLFRGTMDVVSNQTSESEFIVYNLTDIPNELKDNRKISKIDIKLETLRVFGMNEGEIKGDWNFTIESLNDKYAQKRYCNVNVNKQLTDNTFVKNIIIENNGILGTLKLELDLGKTKTDNDDNFYIRVLDKENKIKGKFNIDIAQCWERSKEFVSPINDGYKYLPNLNENEEYKILIYINEDYEKIENGTAKPYTMDFIYNTKNVETSTTKGENIIGSNANVNENSTNLVKNEITNTNETNEIKNIYDVISDNDKEIEKAQKIAKEFENAVNNKDWDYLAKMKVGTSNFIQYGICNYKIDLYNYQAIRDGEYAFHETYDWDKTKLNSLFDVSLGRILIIEIKEDGSIRISPNCTGI